MSRVKNRLGLPSHWANVHHLDSPAGGVAANAVFDAHSETFQAVVGHRYWLMASIGSFSHFGIPAMWTLRVSDDLADVVAQVHMARHRGTGDTIFLEVPITLDGVWTAPATGQRTLTLSMQPTSVVWHDWVLDNAYHQMNVIDLGPAS